MKRLAGGVALVCAAVSATFAQGKVLDIFGGVGYGFGIGGDIVTAIEVTSNGTKEDDLYFNLGQGLKFEAGVDWYTMEAVSLQFSAEYSMGIPDFQVDTVLQSTALNYTDETVYQRSLFGIKASVVPRFEVLELLDMYTGVGLGVFWAPLAFEKTRTSSAGTQNASGEIESNPAIAFLGKIGADLPLSDLVTFYAETAFQSVVFAPERRVVEESNVTLFPAGTTAYETDATNAPPPPKTPASNWQIRTGVRFSVL